jgi:hypothetical protein
LIRRIALMAAFTMVPSVAAARSKDKNKSVGMLMPDLSKVLGEAWSVPPELSDRAQPGAVLEVSAAGYRRVLQGCIGAKPNESSLTNVSMQNSLSGGVGWGAGNANASASGSHSMKISFQGPVVLGFDLIDFVPTKECVKKLTAYAQRGDISSLVVVQETLMARVSGCEQGSLSADASMPGGGGSVSASGACQMFSDAPVAVGVKSVSLSQIPEFAGIAGSATAEAPPATPAAADRPTRTGRSRKRSPKGESAMPTSAPGSYVYDEPRQDWPETPIVRRCPHAKVSADFVQRAVIFWQGEGFSIEYSPELLTAEECELGYAEGVIMVSGEDGIDSSQFNARSKNWMDPDDESKTYAYKIRLADDAVTNMRVLIYAIGQSLNLDRSDDPDNAMH